MSGLGGSTLVRFHGRLRNGTVDVLGFGRGHGGSLALASQEDYRANLTQVIEPTSSITQPVRKTGRRIVGSDWQVHGYYPYWGETKMGDSLVGSLAFALFLS